MRAEDLRSPISVAVEKVYCGEEKLDYFIVADGVKDSSSSMARSFLYCKLPYRENFDHLAKAIGFGGRARVSRETLASWRIYKAIFPAAFWLSRVKHHRLSSLLTRAFGIQKLQY